MLHTSKQARRIGLTLQFLASQDGGTDTEVCGNMQKLPADDVTHTPSIFLPIGQTLVYERDIF